jgi:hypothetical protein
MSATKETTFNGKKAIFKSKLKMRDSTILIPVVCTTLIKIATGSDNFFSHIVPSDIELIQKYMCQYTELEDENGDKTNLTLNDIFEGQDKFIVFMLEFLDFNFGLFSEAQKLITVILGRNLEKPETR